MLVRLTKSFNSETLSITIGKTPIPITEKDVHHIFGLAIEGEDIDKKLKLPTINTEEYVLELSEAEKAIIKTLGKGNNGTRSL